MHLRIGHISDDDPKAHIMLADDKALYDFLKALRALDGRVFDGLLDQHSLNRVAVDWAFPYHIDFPQSGHLENKRRRQETLLLKPFFDLFWGGFQHMTITGATDEAQRDRLLESVQKDRWATAQECIDVLQNLNLAGRIAYQQGDYHAAHKHWEHAEFT